MAKQKKLDNISLENCEITFKNFAGKEGNYNREGDRNFVVLLSTEEGASLKELGWNVKFLKPREEGDPERPYLQVKVKYTNVPPRIVMVTSHGKTTLDEDDVKILDWADIKNVDLIISPYQYDVNGHSGVSAYCKTMYVTINEDPFAAKYDDGGDDVPDTALNTTTFKAVTPNQVTDTVE